MRDVLVNVKAMLRNHKLAKAIADASWGMLTRFLEYKCERAGKAFVKCDRWFPSTKTCSACGTIKDKINLSERTWTCSSCGVHHDRDINAAINIRDEGLRILAGGAPASASGGSVNLDLKRNLQIKVASIEARNLALKKVR